MSKVIQARALPRITGGVARLANGRTVNVTNSMGLRIAPNAEVSLLEVVPGRYTVIGVKR